MHGKGARVVSEPTWDRSERMSQVRLLPAGKGFLASDSTAELQLLKKGKDLSKQH